MSRNRNFSELVSVVAAVFGPNTVYSLVRKNSILKVT